MSRLYDELLLYPPVWFEYEIHAYSFQTLSVLLLHHCIPFQANISY